MGFLTKKRKKILAEGKKRTKKERASKKKSVKTVTRGSGLGYSKAKYLKDLKRDYPIGKFNWGALVFGGFYYLFKGVYRMGLLLSLIAIFLFPIGLISWIYAGFKFNQHYIENETRKLRGF